MEAGEFATIQELAEAVGLAERHVSRQSTMILIRRHVRHYKHSLRKKGSP